jgi:hypothetical protein
MRRTFVSPATFAPFATVDVYRFVPRYNHPFCRSKLRLSRHAQLQHLRTPYCRSVIVQYARDGMAVLGRRCRVRDGQRERKNLGGGEDEEGLKAG